MYAAPPYTLRCLLPTDHQVRVIGSGVFVPFPPQTHEIMIMCILRYSRSTSAFMYSPRSVITTGSGTACLKKWVRSVIWSLCTPIGTRSRVFGRSPGVPPPVSSSLLHLSRGLSYLPVFASNRFLCFFVLCLWLFENLSMLFLVCLSTPEKVSPVQYMLGTLFSNVMLLAGGVVMCFVTSWRLSMLAFTTVGPVYHITQVSGRHCYTLLLCIIVFFSLTL